MKGLPSVRGWESSFASRPALSGDKVDIQLALLALEGGKLALQSFLVLSEGVA